MKKYLSASFILLLILSASCFRRSNITISGSIEHGAKQMIYLDYLEINKTVAIDSTRVKKDDSFSFKFYTEHPGIYILRTKEGKIINLLPSPGEELRILTEYEHFSTDYTVAGSKESEYLRQLVTKLQDTRHRLKKLDDAYSTLSSTNENQASEYINRRKAIIKDQRDYSIQFIIEHLKSIASIYAIYQQISEGQYVLGENRDIQYMKILADSLSVTWPEVDFVSSFVNDARNSEQKFYNLKSLSSKLEEAKVGLPDIIIPDMEGDSVSLSSLKGKTVLVYFWSSASRESRTINPELKSLYDRNKGKGFEVYAIALENNKEKWKQAVFFDELDWINVSELSYPQSAAANTFNVKSIPSTFLINKEGEIVGRDLFGSELQKWLDNLL